MKRAAACTLAVALVAVAPSASAGVEDTLGLGARATALGGSYAARPGDFAAAYYNPAGLAPGGRIDERGGFVELTFGLVYAHPTLRVTGTSGQNLGTPYVADTAGAILGARFSVGQPLHIDGLDMGISLYAPSSIFRWSIRPDDDMQWALLGDRTQALSTHVGLAYRVARWLSIGAGLRILFGTQTNTAGHVTGVSVVTDAQGHPVRTSTQLGTDAEVFGAFSPSFGVTLTPIDALRVGLVYRHKSYVDDWGTTSITDVPVIGSMGYTSRYAHYFEPSEFTFAAGADLGAGIDVSVDLTFGRWSEALSTNRNFYGNYIWGDTWTPAFGARWHVADALSLMGGYRFQKSPLGGYAGPSNLLDADRHVPSMGVEIDLVKIWPAIDARVTLGLANVVLVERTAIKDFRRFPSDDALVKNAGYPSYSFGGHLFTGSASVEARW